MCVVWRGRGSVRFRLNIWIHITKTCKLQSVYPSPEWIYPSTRSYYPTKSSKYKHDPGYWYIYNYFDYWYPDPTLIPTLIIDILIKVMDTYTLVIRTLTMVIDVKTLTMRIMTMKVYILNLLMHILTLVIYVYILMMDILGITDPSDTYLTLMIGIRSLM